MTCGFPYKANRTVEGGNVKNSVRKLLVNFLEVTSLKDPEESDHHQKCSVNTCDLSKMLRQSCESPVIKMQY